MIPQFADPATYSPTLRNVYLGLSLFCLGLTKKVALADSVAPIADRVFAAGQIGPVGIGDAWAGALAYAMQIYFDFSGYTDMALGMSSILGLALPINFNSPWSHYTMFRQIAVIRSWHTMFRKGTVIRSWRGELASNVAALLGRQFS